jgi:hypothetical protein
MTPRRKNAIEKRLDLIEDLWNGFAQNPDSRLCRWLVTPAEARLIEAFVEFQNEEGSEVPDLFLRLDAPFASAERHGFTLRDAVARQYEDVRQPLRDEGFPADWNPPAAQSGETGIAALVRVLGSFRQHCSGMMEHLAVAILPTRIDDPKAWAAWVQALLKAPLPSGVRVLVTDDPGTPALAKLAEAEPRLVQSIRPELDLPAAYMDLARGDGRLHPGVLFRLNFLALTQAAATGASPARIQELSANAIGIAKEQGWPSMEAAIQMTLASACLGAGNSAGALAAYQSAGTAAQAAAKNGDPAGPKLIVHARLAEGSALISAGRAKDAAPLYEESAAMAAQLPDPFLTMESWRMAAYCHEAGKRVEDSWRCGNLALDAAAKLKPSDRAASPLPHVGHGMLRVIGRGNRELIAHVQKRMTELLGPDWAQPKEGGVAPA